MRQTEPLTCIRGCGLPHLRGQVGAQPDERLVGALKRIGHVREGGGQREVGPVPGPRPPSHVPVVVPDDDGAPRMNGVGVPRTYRVEAPGCTRRHRHRRPGAEHDLPHRPGQPEGQSAHPEGDPASFPAAVGRFDVAAPMRPVDVSDAPAPAAEQKKAWPCHLFGQQHRVGPSDLVAAG